MTDLFNQPSSYYNTNNESGATLQGSKAKAESQEGMIKDIFKRMYPNLSGLTADDIAGHTLLSTTPITSIRRALTNLSSKKWNYFLEKSSEMRIGSYGKMVHVYKIKNTK